MIESRHIHQACTRALDALVLASEKPSPKGEPGSGGSIVPPMPLPAGVISAKRELRDMLLDWVSLVSEGLEVVAHCDNTEAAMLGWIGTGERADYLAGHEAGQDFLDEITEVVKALESPYLPRAGKKYWGNHDGQAIYIRDGQRDVALDDGTTVPVMEIRDAAADRLLNYEGPAEQVALIIREYFGHEITAKQIVKARDNDKRNGKANPLVPVQTVGRNHIYNVEQVLNRLCRK